MNKAFKALGSLWSKGKSRVKDDMNVGASSAYGIEAALTSAGTTGLGSLGSHTKGHSGYGHSGHGHSGGYGGHGHGGYGKAECCPLVVDPLTLGALLSFIGLATALLNTVITMSLRRRRKRRDGTYALNAASVSEKIYDVIFSSKLSMPFSIPFL